MLDKCSCEDRGQKGGIFFFTVDHGETCAAHRNFSNKFPSWATPGADFPSEVRANYDVRVYIFAKYQNELAELYSAKACDSPPEAPDLEELQLSLRQIAQDKLKSCRAAGPSSRWGDFEHIAEVPACFLSMPSRKRVKDNHMCLEVGSDFGICRIMTWLFWNIRTRTHTHIYLLYIHISIYLLYIYIYYVHIYIYISIIYIYICIIYYTCAFLLLPHLSRLYHDTRCTHRVRLGRE